MKTKKDIEVVIREMIEKVKELNKYPDEILLTQEHYDELFEKLRGELEHDKYEIFPRTIVYHRTLSQPRINEFMGIAVSIASETRINFH